MHASSLQEMRAFFNEYVSVGDVRVLDVGSRSVSGGSYRRLLRANDVYVGVDIVAGPNVDVVLSKSEGWSNELDHNFDVVISGQVMEHVFDLKQFVLDVAACIKQGGMCCLIAPWKFGMHMQPDCWRILPAGMHWLLESVAQLEVVKVYYNKHDTIGIARKPNDATS